MQCPICDIAIVAANPAPGPFAGSTCSRECARVGKILDAADRLLAELPALAMTIENLRLTLVEVR